MESRAVMKLSKKCRSGRERLRTVPQRPSGRAGKTPHAFSDDERVAAEGNGDMVVPARKTSAFEVVETELAHLRERNHTRAFWSLIGKVIPDYDRRRDALKQLGPRLVW